MEKRLALTLFSLVFMAVFVPKICFSQEVSFERKIRMQLWAEFEAYPGLFPDDALYGQEDDSVNYDESIFAHAIRQLKTVAPFLLNGMVYGWEFDYTPSDKLRGVPEYFDMEIVRPFDEESRLIKYQDPRFEIDEGKVCCWISFERNDAMVNSYQHWADIKKPRIKGIGGGKLSSGFEGIQEAAENALKEAVREHFRKTLRNKPKQITGRVLVADVPALLIKSGEYQIQLDFFLETDRIKEYNQF